MDGDNIGAGFYSATGEPEDGDLVEDLLFPSKIFEPQDKGILEISENFWRDSLRNIDAYGKLIGFRLSDLPYLGGKVLIGAVKGDDQGSKDNKQKENYAKNPSFQRGSFFRGAISCHVRYRYLSMCSGGPGTSNSFFKRGFPLLSRLEQPQNIMHAMFNWT